ncbi:metal ion permease [Mucilaginibacter robiniae]|uniref:Metal ion permease n=1 Tax=Mucilaginibacter robiniae TaxID=2728022 RepID=A0A7L5DYK0_9SPHI|nr:permease [Mucilaginibacter robiniae]QJD96085.1 metal ion permease [Mucilaginibacter robiniae]
MMHIIEQIVIEFLQMLWDIAWGLLFGFLLSAVIRAFISTETISSRLGKDTAGAIGLSTFFGAISSSCSYAAASMARTLIIKGATWSNAVAFMVSSTNLVFEIFIVIVTLLGWPFFGGEIVGGLLFILLSATLIALFFPESLSKIASVQASKNSGADNDPHAHHSSSAMHHREHNAHHKSKLGSPFIDKLKQASGHFYMDVMMVGKDILIGIALSAILMVLVPEAFWKSLFITGQSHLPHFIILAWNAIIGILIAIFAFVCSVGNIVLAGVLWHGGISFGGVIAFILSDLVTIPMLMVYKKYYGWKMMWVLLAILSASIFLTALSVDYLFEALHWIPKTHGQAMQMGQDQFTWDYGAWLNLLFISLGLFCFFYGKKQTGNSGAM